MNKELTRPELAVIGFFTRFLRENFKRLPAWARAVSYFVALAFFCITAYRYTVGDFVIPGRVFVRNTDGRLSPAMDYAIHVGERDFGTNAKGQYFVVLPAPYYYATLFAPTTELNIDDKDGPLDETYTTRFRYLTRDFADIRVKPRSAQQASVPVRTPSQTWLELIPSAFADPSEDPKASYDRLFVEQVRLSGRADTAGARLDLDFGKGESELLTFGKKAGDIQVVAGERVDLGAKYYLPMPQSRPADPAPNVELRGDGLWPFRYAESFKLNKLPQVGKTIELPGDKGSTLVVRRMSAIDVTIAAPPAFSEEFGKLHGELLGRGIQSAATSARKQPNVLVVGQGVPDAVVTELLKALSAHGLTIDPKKVSRLQSKVRPFAVSVEYSETSAVEDEPFDALAGTMKKKQ
jgi:hypothetical protein